jgi:hypothetical protein
MASYKIILGAIFTASFYLSASLAFPGRHQGAYPVGNSQSTGPSPDYYKFTCPQADEIVVSILKKAIAKEQRMAASLLRLLFHDCFVQVSSSKPLFLIQNKPNSAVVTHDLAMHRTLNIFELEPCFHVQPSLH